MPRLEECFTDFPWSDWPAFRHLVVFIFEVCSPSLSLDLIVKSRAGTCLAARERHRAWRHLGGQYPLFSSHLPFDAPLDQRKYLFSDFNSRSGVRLDRSDLSSSQAQLAPSTCLNRATTYLTRRSRQTSVSLAPCSYSSCDRCVDICLLFDRVLNAGV